MTSQESNEELDAAKLAILAEKVKPAVSRTKKGKKFADKSFMLTLVDSVNKTQEEKIQKSLERESEVLKRLARRGSKKSQKRETKGEKVAKMKEALRKNDKKGGRPSSELSKGKGDHRDFGKNNKGGGGTLKTGRKEKPSTDSRPQRSTTHSTKPIKDKSKRQVSFRQ